MSHTKCTGTSSKGSQGRIITHAFTIALYSLLSHTIILPCSTDIPLLYSAFFTLFIYFSCGLLNLPPFTLDPIFLFTNWSSSILSLC